MPNCSKLYDRVKAAPNGCRFEELCSLAECAGFEFKRQIGTSHRIYKKPGAMALMNFQEGSGGKAKPYQVRQLLEFIAENKITFDEDGQS